MELNPHHSYIEWAGFLRTVKQKKQLHIVLKRLYVSLHVDFPWVYCYKQLHLPLYNMKVKNALQSISKGKMVRAMG